MRYIFGLNYREFQHAFDEKVPKTQQRVDGLKKNPYSSFNRNSQKNAQHTQILKILFKIPEHFLRGKGRAVKALWGA